MTLGGKYKWKPNENPAPGQYDPEDGNKLTKPSSRAFQYKQDQARVRNPEVSPDAGEYDPDTGFGGQDNRKMTLGGKYKWKPNDNPPPGLYEPDAADGQIKARVPSTIIKQEQKLY